MCHDALWSSEYNLQESVLFFHPVGLKVRTQVLRLGGQCLNPMNYIDTPFQIFLNECMNKCTCSTLTLSKVFLISGVSFLPC